MRYPMHATYSTQATVKPGGAVFAALIVFAFATTLAVFMVWSRRTITLDPPVTPEGWSVSFRPPGGWQPDFEYVRDDAISFQEPLPRRPGRLLIVQRLPASAARSLEEVAVLLWTRWGYPGLERILARPLRPEIRTAPAGSFPGVRIEDGARGLYVAVGTIADHVVSFGLITGTPLDESDFELINRVLDSVRVLR